MKKFLKCNATNSFVIFHDKKHPLKRRFTEQITSYKHCYYQQNFWFPIKYFSVFFHPFSI